MRGHLFSFFWILLLAVSCRGQSPSTENGSTGKAGPAARIVRSQGVKTGVVKPELVDSQGNIWFSLSGEGIYRYDGKSFSNFTVNDGLCSNKSGSIIQDRKGNILIGTDRGICRYDGKSFSKYPVPDTLSITCMLEDKGGNLWFGTRLQGIFRYNGSTLENFLNSASHEYNLGSKNQLILSMLQDKKGNLWFASWNGGGVWKYDGREFKNFLPSPEYYQSHQDKRAPGTWDASADDFVPSPDHICDDMIYSMTEDHAGNIWFATRDHGVCLYNGDTFTTFGKDEGLTIRGATAILEDADQGFWITSFDNGVWYFDGKTFKNFTEKDGLVNDAVMNVLQDREGNLWFGTKYLGLSRYDGESFITFSRHEDEPGLFSPEK